MKQERTKCGRILPKESQYVPAIQTAFIHVNTAIEYLFLKQILLRLAAIQRAFLRCAMMMSRSIALQFIKIRK